MHVACALWRRCAVLSVKPHLLPCGVHVQSNAVHAITLSFGVQPGVTVPYDKTLRPNTTFVPIDMANGGVPDMRVVDNYTETQPQQARQQNLRRTLPGPYSGTCSPCPFVRPF